MVAMGMNIKDDEAHELARELARLKGVTLTQAVKDALREQLNRTRVTHATSARPLANRLNEIALRCASLPDLDTRSPDEIIGYDEQGLPR